MWTLRWALLFAFWVALTDTRRWQELAVGAIAAGVGATVAAAVRIRGASPSLRRSAAVLTIGPRLLRPLWLLVRDCGRLVTGLRRRVAGRPLQGGFRAAVYRPDPARRSAGGRIATELLGSLPGNRIVVGIDDEEGTILVHELVRSDEPLDPLERR